MSTLDASRNDTRLVINRGLTVSEYIHGPLGGIKRGYSFMLGSVDIKQIVKNICTPQKYIFCSYFLTLTKK